MISKDKQYRTRDGREVRIYATDCGSSEPVHGAIKSCEDWLNNSWNLNGKFILNKTSEFDLIEVKPRIKRESWVNVYEDRVSSSFDFKKQADHYANHNRIACVKVEIDCEEGEGL